MRFSDDDLRAALGRKEPSPDFTERVMEKINRPPSAQRRPIGAWWRRPWAMASAAACLLLVVALGQYQRYEQKQMEAKTAREQAVLALRIVSGKLNVALRQAIYGHRSDH